MFSPVFGVHQVCTTTSYYRIPSLHAHLTNCHLGFLSQVTNTNIFPYIRLKIKETCSLLCLGFTRYVLPPLGTIVSPVYMLTSLTAILDSCH